MVLHPSLQRELAHQRQQDRLAAAEHHRLVRAAKRHVPIVRSRVGGGLLYLRQLETFDRQALAELTGAVLDVAPPRSDALGAFAGDGDRLVGLAQYGGGDEPDGPKLGVLVDDDWQRRGVGTALATLIIARARAARHAVMHVQVPADNRAGLQFVRRLGFESTGRDGLFVVLELAL